MISNKEVRQSFKKLLDLPDVLTGLNRLNNRKNKNYRLSGKFSLQIHRGQAPRFWENAPRGGCSQCIALFMDFGVVPKYCFDCYKVMVELRTVVELFKLLMVFEKIKLPRDNTRKCMVEQRPSSPVPYKGFVYCRGLEEANELCRIIGEAVADDISPDITVKVKRGCSEYAEIYPEYAQINAGKEAFKYGEDWQFYEDFVDKNWVFDDEVDCYDEDGKGTDPMRELFALQFWLRHAATLGDRSYLILTGGKHLKPLA